MNKLKQAGTKFEDVKISKFISSYKNRLTLIDESFELLSKKDRFDAKLFINDLWEVLAVLNSLIEVDKIANKKSILKDFSFTMREKPIVFATAQILIRSNDNISWACYEIKGMIGTMARNHTHFLKVVEVYCERIDNYAKKIIEKQIK